MPDESEINRIESSPCIAIIPGEGIGPEVTAAAIDVLEACATSLGIQIGTVVEDSVDAAGDGGLLRNPSRIQFLDDAFKAGIPVLHGPAGGRYVYELRTRFDLFVKRTPIRPVSEIEDAFILRPERLDGVDILVVRDNAAGFYQGRFGSNETGTLAFQQAEYSEAQVIRVLTIAVSDCLVRRGKLSVVVKPGGAPTISRLWMNCAEAVAPSEIELEFVEADNACYQVIADPKRFDVIVAPNMFGDLIGDTASVLLGSRGMSFSANFGPHDEAVFQTAHGAALDIAGQDVANPIGHITTLSWLLSHVFNLKEASTLIDESVREVLSAGIRTKDIATKNSQVVSTGKFAAEVVSVIHSKPSRQGGRS